MLGTRNLKNYVRIVGGEFKRQRLKVLSAKALRPTSDRIREMIFNWLSSSIAGAQVADLFAGTGALGFEAISRGAAHVHFIDNNPRVVDQLKQNCQRFEISASRATVRCTNTLSWLKQVHQQWHLVFVDPPFERLDLYQKTLELLSDRLLPSGMIYVEHERRATHHFENFSVWKSSTVGEVHCALLKPKDHLAAETL